MVWLGAPLGALAGAAIGGWTAQHADWRSWFIGLSVPGFLTAVLAMFTLREPRRGAFDAGGLATGAIPSIGAAMRFLFAKPSMRHVLAGAAFAAIAMNGMGQFFARYFVAVFHLGTAQAGRLLGSLAVVAMSSGLVIGGFGIDWAVRRDRRWYAWGPASAALAMPLFEIGLFQPTLARTMAALLLAHVALFIYYTPTLAIAQNMVDATMRASSAFTVAIVFGLVGAGLGPTIVGIISDLAARQSFDAGQFSALCPGGAARPAQPPGQRLRSRLRARHSLFDGRGCPAASVGQPALPACRPRDARRPGHRLSARRAGRLTLTLDTTEDDHMQDCVSTQHGVCLHHRHRLTGARWIKPTSVGITSAAVYAAAAPSRGRCCGAR